MSDDELYDGFIEEYFASGKPEIAESWSEDLKERCRLFLKLAKSTTQSGSREESLLATLTSDGVQAELTLEGSGNEPPEELSSGRERYVVEEEIARGGMGRILLAYDRDFRRRIAMKVLLGPEHRIATSRFLEEAQATGQLEHPNIAPVYDVGVDDEGAPYFTMKWIRGRNLAEILRADEEEFTLIRLVQILQQVVMGVEFAHSRGVVHRDLKPHNIMVGDYGEVLVMDWGLAKILGRAGEEEGDEDTDTVMTSRAEKGIHTLRGAVQGSAAYMAPEQARGEVDDIDARTDVYGLGSLLYAILSGSVPYDGATFQEVLGKARRGEIVPLRERVPDVPRALEEICERAMAPRREDRFASAREMYDRLQDFVEGIHDAERRRAEASRLLVEAEEVRGRWEAACAKDQEHREREARLQASVEPSEPAERKQELWQQVAETRAATAEVERLFGETTAAYHAVLSVDAEHSEARECLAGLYFKRMLEAEDKGDAATANVYRQLTHQQKDPTYERRLDDSGLVRLATDPPGAEVYLARYEERGLLLEESVHEHQGVTPYATELARGSYLFVLRKAGFRDIRYPVFVERGGRIEELLRFYRESEIPDGFVQIPQGVSVVGGDRQLLSSLERSQQTFGELFVLQHPVTIQEYCLFLDDKLGGVQEDDEEYKRTYERLVPKFGEELLEQDKENRFRPKKNSKGQALHPRTPVMAIHSLAMLDYSRWRGEDLGATVELLTEAEWERCARGADGRLYPWGNEFDWALAHGGSSLEVTLPAEVGRFPTDRSPFDVRDLAGCAREVCASKGADVIPLKGGSWYYNLKFLFRCDSRTMFKEKVSKSLDVGFRVKLSRLPGV